MSAIQPKEVKAIVAEHDAAVSKNKPTWRAYRHAYSDNFWAAIKNSTSDGSGRSVSWTNEYPLLVEVNHVRRVLDSFVDSLYHKRLRTVVRPEPVFMPEGMDKPSPEPLALALDGWLNHADIEDILEQLFCLCLIYPEGGLKIGVDRGVDDPVAAIWADAMPAWECVWDRKSRSMRDLRYVGHIYWCSREEFLTKYPDYDETKLKTAPKPDELMEDHADPSQEANQGYVRLLEFYDLTCQYTSKPAEDDPNGEEEVTDGAFRVYVLGGDTPEIVFDGPMPYFGADGRPLAPIIPVVLNNVPEYRMMGLPLVATTYHRNEEINWSRTYLANAARKDAARKLMVRKDAGLDEQAKSQLVSGKDGEVVEVESDSLNGVAQWMETPNLPTSVLEYTAFLQQDLDATAGLSPNARGQALKYATAQEVTTLNDYTETQLGRIRKRMDQALIRALHLYTRVLAHSMDVRKKDFIPIERGDEVIPLHRDYLEVRWRIDVADAASTPLAEQQRRVEFLQIQPQLLELAAAAEQPGLPGAMATAMLQYLHDLFDLPMDFDLPTLRAKATLAEPVPPEPGAAALMGAPPEMGGVQTALAPPVSPGSEPPLDVPISTLTGGLNGAPALPQMPVV